ncbi:vomeronasal type-1 receptor 4-like [Sciurus carolinensis]|uniref:vomeronasal type-1 receptor 4-like n=1 Tax=Sciurus carolinensis TaxID=30640 RepID=UPI001FB236BA|nr:vomeronasal type-1 receptor 4-like [Sciurus carolinensis]
MASRNVVIGLMFLSQIAVGILGNLFQLYYYLVLSCNEHPLRSTDLILKHLSVANALIILTNGVPRTMAAFSLKYFFSDFVCKLILYIQRVGRSVSIGITCLLSVIQNITVSPMNSCWKNIKRKAPKHIGFSISLCWILYMVVHSIFSLYAVGKQRSENLTKKRYLRYCSSASHDKITETLYAALCVFPEVVFSMLTIWSSGSMILLLHRHKRRVQHIHSISVSSRYCPESRATKRILVLVCTFVSFHTLSSILHVCIMFHFNPSWWLVNINALISMCFPTVSPFLFSRHDFVLSRLCF